MSIARMAGFNDYLSAGLGLPKGGANQPILKEFRNGLYLTAFTGAGGTIEESWTSFHILHDYKDGTKVYPHVHWAHNIASPSGDVVWKMDYSVAKGHSGGAFPAPTTVSLQQTAGAQYTHQIIETSDGNAIAATNLEPDTVIIVRIYRDPADGNDTFENDAFLINVDLHYEGDGL
ncbi:hypothetical protein KAR91_64500 [Candidatus Pacearchaeota archaeon]|nr:hypothetical protein [Candidatus Pacearchaeota archaeon]